MTDQAPKSMSLMAHAPALPFDLAYPILFYAAALQARGPPTTHDDGCNDDFSDQAHEPNPTHLISLLVALPPTNLDTDHASSHRTLQRILLPHLPWLSPAHASESCNLRILDWWRDHAPNWSPIPLHPIQLAIEQGHLPVIEWWWTYLSPQTHLRERVFARVLDAASQYGCVDILDFVGSHTLHPAYTHAAIDRAASVQVLDWWLERCIKDGWEPPRYTPRAFAHARMADNAKQWLDWWMDRAHGLGGWPFRLSDIVLHTVSAMGQVAALEWWKVRGPEAGIVFRVHDPNVNPDEEPQAVTASTLWYSHNALDAASSSGQLVVLDWWLHSGFTLAYSEAAITDAAWNGHDDVLRWWKRAIDEHGLERKLDSELAISYASSAGHTHVLDWLLDESGWPFEYNYDVVDFAAAEGSIHTLNWWWARRDRLEFRYSASALDRACQHSHWDVVEWFKDHALEPRCSETALDMVIQKGNIRILRLWESAGWPVKVGIAWERVLKLRARLGDDVFGFIQAWWQRQDLPM
ncbi:hypothetical protein BCR44DRAFT_37474 [Catenaria anguillulae PL171]|uniref:Ankyrin repeat-containing domain protein n=1 Tax=Catenaria anguillulae PL171 TaxID=765915 RepID=A0A1Y2HKU4_9FUNG|nr:hypothetical protein BCR44DRAFT_37474 [Catenaria anguillulae PL171]